MVEVFTVDVQDQIKAETVVEILQGNFPALRIDIDVNESESSFPCGHSILRVEGVSILPESIISIVNDAGYQCSVLEDKICE